MTDPWTQFTTPTYPPSLHPYPVVIVTREPDGCGEIGVADIQRNLVWWSGMLAKRNGSTVIEWRAYRAIEAQYRKEAA